MSTSQREIYIDLAAGQSKNVPTNEFEFIYVKTAIRPVLVTVEGQSVSMEAGEKRRFVSPVERFDVTNPDQTRPLSVVLVVGVGDYEKLVVSGEISFNPSLQLADGSRVGDSRQPENFYLDFDKKTGWTDTVHTLKDTSVTVPGGNKWATAYDSKRDLFYFGGPFSATIYRIDAESFAKLSDITMAAALGANGFAYRVETDELWLVHGDRVRVLNLGTMLYSDNFYPLALSGTAYGADFDPITGRLMVRHGSFLTWLDPDSLEQLDQVDLGAKVLYASGAVARHPNGNYYLGTYGSAGIAIFDEDFNSLGLALGSTAYDMAIDMNRNRYVSGKALATLKKYVAKTVNWVGSAAVSDSPYRALIGANYVNIESDVVIDNTGSRAVLSGEVIRALLESYFGAYDAVPADYLDYVYAFEYFDGTRRKVKQAGGESFLSAEYTDNFNAAAGQRMVLTVRDGLL